jgi:hypothetical protein
MKIEKKLILCSILAITIGIATIIPLQYLMTAEAKTNADTLAEAQDAIAEAQTITQATQVEPWYNVDVMYAYCNPNDSGEWNETASWTGASIRIMANFTLIPEAPKIGEAQIEYYKFAVSSEQGPIIDLYYYIAQDQNTSVINGLGGNGWFLFTNGLTYSGIKTSGGQGGSYSSLWGNYTSGDFIEHITNENPPDFHGVKNPEAIAKIRNAQTLYIDVTKAITVKVTGNITVTEPASDEILQHIELTKVSDGFLFGGYKRGTMLVLPQDEPPHTTP